MLARDMEMTALMAVAMRRRAALAGIIITADELYTGVWNPRFDSEEVAGLEKKAARAMMEAAKSLAKT